MLSFTETDSLQQENERLRQEVSRLRGALEDVRSKLSEPAEVIRAIHRGEIDALIVEEEGREEIYALQRFDSVYRTVVEECFPFGVWLAKPDGRLLYVSASFLELLGTDLEELQSKGQFHFLPPEIRDPVVRAWDHARATGTPCNVEYPVRGRDGQERVIWTQGMLAPTHDGLSHWVGVNIDITERERTRRELRQQAEELRLNEQRFKLLADAMPQFVWEAQPDGFTEYFNQRWYDYTGCPPEKCLGHNWISVLHPDDQERTRRRWEQVASTGNPYEIEYRLRSRDGDYHWFLTRAIPFRNENGDVTRWFGTCTDIELLKRAEMALRESEARYRNAEERLIAALTASDTGTFRWDPDTGTFLDFDESLRDLLGLSPEIPVRTTDEFLRLVHPEDQQHVKPALERCCQGSDLELEFRVLLPDSNVRWLYGRAKLTRDAQGRPSYLVGACTDITKRTRIEERLKLADRRKDEFLATLAHELRNPLAPIHTGLELLRLAGNDGELMEDVRNTMEGQARQLVRLVDDLLDVSRITSGKIRLKKERVDLATAVRSAVDAVRPLISDAGHELIVSLPPTPVVLEADPIRLAQILTNLLTNAAKYTENGGRIWISAEQHNEEAVIRIKDTGIGIPADMIDRIFEMFAQIDRSLERSHSGLGIGLTLVRRLVEMHGGSVHAASDGPGQGSEFIIRLPVPCMEAPARASPETSSRIKQGNLRVLIVDDNQDAAKTLGLLVKMLGNEIETAHDGLQAVEKAASFRPDVILMDLGMPNLNGFDAALRIRRQSGGEKVVLVALTGWGQDEDKQRARLAGFNHHFVKPVDVATLQKLLTEIEQERSRHPSDP